MRIFHKDHAVEFVAGKKHSLLDFILTKEIIDAHIHESGNPDQDVRIFMNRQKKMALFTFEDLTDEEWDKLVKDLKNWAELKEQLVKGGVLK